MRGLLLYELYLCLQEKQRRGLNESIEINNNNEDESEICVSFNDLFSLNVIIVLISEYQK